METSEKPKKVKNFTEEGRQRIRERHKGIAKTPEQKEKMRQAKLGVPKSESHKAAMRAAHARRKAERAARLRELIALRERVQLDGHE